MLALATDHTIMEGVHYVKIEHSDPKTDVVDARWVDPTREDIIVRWEHTVHTVTDLQSSRSITKNAVITSRSRVVG